MSQEKLFIDTRAKRKKPRKLTKIKVEESPVTVTRKGNAYKHTRTGYRDDLDLVLRSGWEANFCRVLRSYDIEFEFEPQAFHFPIKRGNKGYVPDFWLPTTEEWVEVKGYLDNNSKIKIKRFKKYFPEDFAKLTIITGSAKASLEFFKSIEVPRVLLYSEFRREYKSTVKNWEG